MNQNQHLKIPHVSLPPLLSFIRLQLDPGYVNLSTTSAARKLWAEKGMYGFFQGAVPPLVGSSFYRMAMLSTYEAAYTYFSRLPKDSVWHLEIAGGYVPRPLVFASAVCASLARSVVESPFEYFKVMASAMELPASVDKCTYRANAVKWQAL